MVHEAGVGLHAHALVHRFCLYNVEVIICYQMPFQGLLRVIVYSVFGVGAEIPLVAPG